MYKFLPWIFIALGLCIMPLAFAEEKPSCPLQLAQKTVEAKNLDDERDAKEQKIAALQVQLYFEGQTRKALQAQIDELKKQAEPKPEESKENAPHQ